MQRFWSKARRSGECLIWKSSVTSNGRYGNFKIGGKAEAAHRVAYRLSHGPFPEGMCVCHTCDNGLCIEPTHLFLGTQKDNIADCINKGRRPDASGEKSPNAKLTKFQVDQIRASHGKATRRVLAEKFGVSMDCISRIFNGSRWPTHSTA